MFYERIYIEVSIISYYWITTGLLLGDYWATTGF